MLEQTVSGLRLAALSGQYTGLIRTAADKAYMERCRAMAMHQGLGVAMIFTRDTGHHTSGWWKNPDYERCWHLSLSFFDLCTYEPEQYRSELASSIAHLFFGDDIRYAWVEPPYTDEGKLRGVHHYRVFADEGWQALMPRGEVYGRDSTPSTWKSFSEIHGAAGANFEA
jgi:hypothetical protein